jgi:hypothetical protein
MLFHRRNPIPNANRIHPIRLYASRDCSIRLHPSRDHSKRFLTNKKIIGLATNLKGILRSLLSKIQMMGEGRKCRRSLRRFYLESRLLLKAESLSTSDG